MCVSGVYCYVCLCVCVCVCVCSVTVPACLVFLSCKWKSHFSDLMVFDIKATVSWDVMLFTSKLEDTVVLGEPTAPNLRKHRI
jgi:hypothetical protein